MARFDSTDATQAKIITAAGKQVQQCYESLYMDIDDGVFITNAPGNVTIADGIGSGSNVYFTVGQFLGFSAVQEEKIFTTSEVTVSLSGLPSHELGTDFISDILQFDYVDKDVRIFRTFFDRDVEIGSFLMFKGRIDSPVIKENTNETTTLAATCSSHWVDYERDNGIITNDNRQKDLYSGDKGFEFAKQVIKDVQWKT